LRATTLGRLCWHALAAHEHTLIDQHPEHAHGPGLVQPAFVATDGHAIGRIFEERTTFLAFVVQSVGGDFGFLVIAHLLIVDLTTNKSYDHVLWAFCSYKRGSMTLCPIALMATCNKCPAVGICPLKEVLGDYKPADHVDDAKSVSQKEESKN
jgi:hypothetical protein